MERFYLIDLLGEANDPSLCVLRNQIEDLGLGDIALGRGERLGTRFPKDARLYLDDEHPGKKLSALLGNTHNLLIVSRELRLLVEKNVGDDVECLPFALYDHRRRLMSRDYCVINPLKTVDCLDLAKSQIAWNPHDPERIMHIGAYVLDRTKTIDVPRMFRLHGRTHEILIGYDLAAEIKSAGLTNVYWRKLPFSDE